jgi:hypothetical protein
MEAMMKKALTAAMAAVTLGGAVAATAAPAEARDWGHHYYGGYYGHRHHGDGGAAVAAGVVGLALGAALANGSHGYVYDRPYYRDYDYGPAYYEPYGVCVADRWVWDPYIGRHVRVRERYPC